jgi:cytoskeleton-associated protein 5
LLSSGEIGQVLKARVTDTNKAVQVLALDIISKIAIGMGKPFERQSRFFVLPVATVLADQKAPIRTAAIQTLASIAAACEGLDSMVHGLNTALETSNPTQKSSLLHWLADWFKGHQPSPSLDLSSWAASVVGSLDDRSGEIRKGAQALLPTLIACSSFDHVMNQTNSLKPASRGSAIPLIQAARGAAPVNGPPLSTAIKSNVAPTPVVPPSPPSESPDSAVAPVAAPNKLPGIRRKLPQGTTSQPNSRAETPVDPRVTGKPGIGGLKRPGAATTITSRASASQTPISSLPFSGPNFEAKKVRLNKDMQRWINEAGPTRKDLADLLQHQMEPHTSKELVTLLFSHDHNAVNDHITGLSMICDFFSDVESGNDSSGLPLDDVKAIALGVFDLPLKYSSIKAHEPQPNLNFKCLDVVEAVLAFLRSMKYQLTDAEALCFIPTMIYKVFWPVSMTSEYI